MEEFVIRMPATMAKLCCWIFPPRGTALVLLMSGLLYAVQQFVYAGIYHSFSDYFKPALDYVHVALLVLLPVTGWVAESWLGRYRAIVVGLVLSSISTLTLQAAFVMLQFNWTPIPALVLTVVSLMIGTFGFGSFYTIMLPFALDQMIGASAEQLSAAVQWYCWVFYLGLLMKDLHKCVPIPNQLHILQMIFLTLATLCFSAVLIMDCLYHKWLDTNNKTGNPIKLIFQVLNYARKNKSPRLRSALTYIDEEHPSRLDFGKHKFGGPFTEEEVEDVKTIFRLTPILTAFVVVFLSEIGPRQVPVSKHTSMCTSSLRHYPYAITTLVLIPVYRFIILPLLHKYVPSLLKMIGAGLITCLVSTMINTAVTATEYFSHNTTTHDSIQVPLYWMAVIELLNGIGITVTITYGIEFAMAQTPNRMRGIMMGVVIAMIGWSTIGSTILTSIIHIFKVSTQNYTLYSSLVLPPLAIMMMIIFVIVAKRYKLRERERHVNIQAIVEEHYERYFDQEEEYMREVADMFNAYNYS